MRAIGFKKLGSLAVGPGFQSLSCQLFLWFHWHLSENPMASMAHWVGQWGFEPVGKGWNPSLYLYFFYHGRKLWYRPPLMREKFRYQKFSETTKGSPTKLCGIVRKNTFDGKSWYPPPLLSVTFFDARKNWNTEGFLYKMENVSVLWDKTIWTENCRTRAHFYP